MENFLPVLRSLRLAEQARSTTTLHESLVGALNQFQAIQQHQKGQRRVRNVETWTRCFLYVAVMAKKAPEMVPAMITHLHTVLKLHIQHGWSTISSSAWRWRLRRRRFGHAETHGSTSHAYQGRVACKTLSRLRLPNHLYQIPSCQGKQAAQPLRELGARERGPQTPATCRKTTTKRPQKAGICHLFNRVPGGCPYMERSASSLIAAPVVGLRTSTAGSHAPTHQELPMAWVWPPRSISDQVCRPHPEGTSGVARLLKPHDQ